MKVRVSVRSIYFNIHTSNTGVVVQLHSFISPPGPPSPHVETMPTLTLMPDVNMRRTAFSFTPQSYLKVRILFAEVIVGIGNKELEAALKGKKLVGACRKGKHMWLEFDSGPALMLHFGERQPSTTFPF